MTWTAILDAYESSIDRLERGLAGDLDSEVPAGSAPDAPHQPPTAVEMARYHALASRAAALASGTKQRLAQLQTELGEGRRQRSAVHGYVETDALTAGREPR